MARCARLHRWRLASGRAVQAAAQPAQLKLGSEVPVSLKSVSVAGREFTLIVPDVDAGGWWCALAAAAAAAAAGGAPPPLHSSLTLCCPVLAPPQ